MTIHIPLTWNPWDMLLGALLLLLLQVAIAAFFGWMLGPNN